MAESVRKRTPRPDKGVVIESGENARYLEHILKSFSMGRVDIDDVQAVEERAEQYFKSCLEDDMKPGVVGFCNYLGISRSHFVDITNGKIKCKSVDTMKKVKHILEEYMEACMQNGKVNPVSGIFLMKNNYANYTDKQEVEVKAIGTTEETPESIAEKYIASLPDPDIIDGTAKDI